MAFTEQTCRLLLGKLASAPYRVAYTVHLSVDTTTSNCRSMSGVLARRIMFLNESEKSLQRIFNNQQLLFVPISLVLEKKLLHQFLHFVNGNGLRM